MTFAEKLQYVRKSKQLSQEELAEKCEVTRQSVSKWETGASYPETEKLLVLCGILDVSLDYLLRDISDIPREGQKEEQPSLYAPYIGKWLQVFLNDKEFNGFYRICLMAIQNTQLLFMDAQGAAIFIDIASVHAVSELTCGKQTDKLQSLLPGGNVPLAQDYFLNRKCNIKLKQGSPLLGFNKPGGLYAVLVTGISDEAVTVQDPKGNKRMVKMPDVLFIQECR